MGSKKFGDNVTKITWWPDYKREKIVEEKTDLVAGVILFKMSVLESPVKPLQ